MKSDNRHLSFWVIPLVAFVASIVMCSGLSVAVLFGLRTIAVVILGSPEPRRSLRDPAELESLVKGKTPDEVKATLGRPDSVSPSDPSRPSMNGEVSYFVYKDALRNRHTGRAEDAHVVFENRRVKEVW